MFSVDHLMGKLKSLGLSSWVNAEIFPKSRRWTYLYVLLLYKKIWVCPQDRRVSPVGYCNSVRMKEIMSWLDHGSKFCNYNIFITSTEDSINVAFVKKCEKEGQECIIRRYILDTASYNSPPNHTIPLQTQWNTETQPAATQRGSEGEWSATQQDTQISRPSIAG